MIIVILVAAVLVLLGLRWFLKADPSALAGAIKQVLLIVVVILAATLLITGRINLILPLVIAALPFIFPYLRKYIDDSPQKLFEGPMTKEEALEILGLKKNATKAQILAAHKRLIKKLHPDTGGSDYLAQKLNAAKDLLMKE